MVKKQDFIDFIDNLMMTTDVPEDIAIYWTAFKGEIEKDKPLFTENGKKILKFLQDNPNPPLWKAKDIAEGMFMSSRAVSGAMRKLAADGFVEKVGQEPVVYSITETGKNITLD